MKKTLSECSKDTTNYLIENDFQTSEFDMSINDISRNTIEAMKSEKGVCFVGKINLYGEERKQDYKLVEYTGQMIYNFEYAFCIPCYDRQLETMINDRDKAPYTGSTDDLRMIKAITNRIEEIGGKYLFWS